MPKTLITGEGLFILAKLSVLQADFPDFYQMMFDYPSLISDFMEVMSGEFEQINEATQLFFDVKKEVGQGEDAPSTTIYTLKKAHESLYSFLTRTASIKCDNYTVYLYLDYDADSLKYGDKLSREIRNSLTSGNEATTRSLLEANKEINLSGLLTNILLDADSFEYNLICQVLINLRDNFAICNTQQLNELVAMRVTSVYRAGNSLDVKTLSFEQLYSLYCGVTEKYGLAYALKQSFEFEDKDYTHKLEIFFGNIESFDDESKQVVFDFVNHILGDKSKISFDQFFEIKSIDLDRDFESFYSSFALFDRMSEYAIDNDYCTDDSNTTSKTIKTLFTLHTNSGQQNELIANVIGHFDVEDYFALLADELLASASISKQVMSKLLTAFSGYSDIEICKKAVQLLTKNDWSIENNQSEKVDGFILKHLDDESIDLILGKIAFNKQIVIIPETIKAINKSIVTNQVGYKTFGTIQQQFSESERTQIIQLLFNQIQYSAQPTSNTIERVNGMVSELAESDINAELVNKTFVAPYFNEITSNPQRVEYTLQVIPLLKTLAKIINTAYAASFLTWTENSSNLSSYTDLVIRIMLALVNHMPTEKYEINTINILGHVTEQSCPEALILMRTFRDEFSESTRTSYLSFLRKCIAIPTLQKEVIADIDDTYESIDDTATFILSIAQYDDISKEVIELANKLLTNSESSETEIANLLTQLTCTPKVAPI